MHSWNSNDRYLSNGGYGPLVAQIISVESGKVKIGYWNGRSKSDSPRVRIAELPEGRFFSKGCGWQKTPPKLLQMESDPDVQSVLRDIVSGTISKREAREKLGCAVEWMNYLYKNYQRSAPA